MAQDTTNNYFSKPAVGGDTDTWGSTLNTNWDTVDSVLAGDTDILALSVVPASATDIAATFTGLVGIGTTSPDSKLDVAGVIKGGDVNATSGGTALSVKYTTGHTLNNFGAMYSSADTLIGFGVESHKSQANKFISTASNSNFERGALTVDNELKFFSADAQTTAVGSEVTMTERMRIDSSGNVGIATDQPLARLDIRDGTALGGTSGDQLLLTRIHSFTGNQTILEISNLRTSTGSNWQQAGTRIQSKIDSTHMGYMQFNGTGSEYGITFGAGSSTISPANVPERMRITSIGNVGIGTDSPSVKLQVAGDATFDGGTSTTVNVLCDDAGNATLNLMGGNQGTGRLYVGQSAAYGGGIEYNGDSVPVTSGAGSDQIALYRRSDGTSHWTARNAHSNNDWEFRGKVTANELAGTLTQSIFNQIYPVGAVYISTSSTSPATLFGGTWTAIGGGRVLQTVSGSTPAAGQNYGANTRAITTSNMPSHSHGFTDFTFQESISHGGQTGQGLGQGLGSGDSDSDNYPARPRSATTGTTGSGTNFDVRQASYGVYMWKRASLA